MRIDGTILMIVVFLQSVKLISGLQLLIYYSIKELKVNQGQEQERHQKFAWVEGNEWVHFANSWLLSFF
jgi:hypothetical protein